MTPKEITALYFSSWKARDFQTFRTLLADQVTFTGPLAQLEGAKDCLAGIQRLSEIMTDIDIKHVWSDETDVITWFELHTNKTSKPLSVVNWSSIQDERIIKIRVTFDPRSLLDAP